MPPPNADRSIPTELDLLFLIQQLHDRLKYEELREHLAVVHQASLHQIAEAKRVYEECRRDTDECVARTLRALDRGPGQSARDII